MYVVSHSAPNEYREMVRTDGTRRLLESSDQLTPELRHDVLPRQSKHAEHFGEIDVAYAARKQARALDQANRWSKGCALGKGARSSHNRRGAPSACSITLERLPI